MEPVDGSELVSGHRTTWAAGRVSPLFRRLVITIEAGGSRPYVPGEWSDAIVVVEDGEVEVEGRCGNRIRVASGEVVWLDGIPLEVLRNHGSVPAVLVAVSRCSARPTRRFSPSGPTVRLPEPNAAPMSLNGAQANDVSSEGFVVTNGIRLWYDTLGPADGQPVVLVMGAGASVLWWQPELVDAIVDAGFQVVRFDNRDVGRSSFIDFAAEPYDLDDMALDLVGLLDGLGIGRAHLVGVSLGGMIIQVVALRRPERVGSLTLISTSPGPVDDRLSRSGGRSVDTAEDMAVDTAEDTTVDPGPARLRAADSARGTNDACSHAEVPPTSWSRVDDLGRIEVPTLIVHGTDDPVFGPDHAVVLSERIRGSTLVLWDGAGHGIPDDRVPGLAQILLAHLRCAG